MCFFLLLVTHIVSPTVLVLCVEKDMLKKNSKLFSVQENRKQKQEPKFLFTISDIPVKHGIAHMHALFISLSSVQYSAFAYCCLLPSLRYCRMSKPYPYRSDGKLFLLPR